MVEEQLSPFRAIKYSTWSPLGLMLPRCSSRPTRAWSSSGAIWRSAVWTRTLRVLVFGAINNVLVLEKDGICALCNEASRTLDHEGRNDHDPARSLLRLNSSPKHHEVSLVA